MRFIQISILALGLSFGSTLLSSSEARAAAKFSLVDSATHSSRPMTLDIMGQVSTNSAGLAVWFGFPIVPNGFIPVWNDAFFIEAGGQTSMFWYTYQNYNAATYTWYDTTETYFATTPMAGVRYNFYLNSDWTVFATAKMGWVVAFSDTNNGYGLASGGSVGAYWHFTEGMALRIEQVSNNVSVFGLQAGISLEL